MFTLIIVHFDVEIRVDFITSGRIYQVLKAQHTQHGRGGATIQVELRDVDSGNKTTERFRTDEAIERVFVEEKSFTFLYTDGDTVMIMEPKTFEQLEVSKDLFGKAAAYLKDNMIVTLQLYDGKPMSASVPQRVTCTVAEAQTPMKGITATPHDMAKEIWTHFARMLDMPIFDDELVQCKHVAGFLIRQDLSFLLFDAVYTNVLAEFRALLDGIQHFFLMYLETSQAPAFIRTDDEIVINTTDDSYITRLGLIRLYEKNQKDFSNCNSDLSKNGRAKRLVIGAIHGRRNSEGQADAIPGRTFAVQHSDFVLIQD
ncbi:hypothetical protein HHK36_017617 [Tetracentron sinense]|uniref:Translation elongation factor P/YeiP central domain-containing protein n=1 Tax=Tetracentron sinense TaxID=13715 RepID=A0A834Z2B2_TETSI|nr:hypothetical protein HHK36_017617 [Tetracentron sinense]